MKDIRSRKRKKRKWAGFLLLLIAAPFLVAGYARYVEPYMLITRTVTIEATKNVPCGITMIMAAVR